MALEISSHAPRREPFVVQVQRFRHGALAVPHVEKTVVDGEALVARLAFEALLLSSTVYLHPALTTNADPQNLQVGVFTSITSVVLKHPNSSVSTSLGLQSQIVAFDKNLYPEFETILSLGGTMGTYIGTAVMRALPLGIPKVMVFTQASGDTPPYVGTKDIIMIPSVADIFGLNRITKNMLTLDAGAIVGMVKVARSPVSPVPSDKPLIGLTVHGDFMPCANFIIELLEQKGYEVVVFHAVGIGGKTLEEWVEQGLLSGVFDLVTTEVLQHMFGGLYDAGPTRLEAAGANGIPQLVAPGKIDTITFDPNLGIPERFKGRKLYAHTPARVGVPTTKEERALLGKVMAEKLNKAIGPTAVIIPKKGFSGVDKEDNEWHDPEANLAFTEALKKNLKQGIRVVEVDAHINDKLFAETAATLLDKLMHEARL